MSSKLDAGAAMPELSLPKVGGGDVRIGGKRDGWQLVVVYRGLHCPICKRYLTKLEGLKPGFEENQAEVVAVSGDPREKAEAEVEELGLSFDVAYDLSPEQMRTLGLYVSNPRSPEETDRQFPEPGLFLINPQGQAQVIDVSNAPFSRPDLENLLNGLKTVRERNYPIRGTA